MNLPRITPIPPALVDVDWGLGADGVGIIVRPGDGRRTLARPGRFGTEVYWNEAIEPSEDGPVGYHTSFRILPGDAASAEAAAYRGLAHLSARGRWSPFLRDYVLAMALEARA